MIAAYYKRLTSPDQVFDLVCFLSFCLTSPGFSLPLSLSGGAQGGRQGVVLVGDGHQQAHPGLRLHRQGEQDFNQIFNSLLECCVMPKGSKNARPPFIWSHSH